MAYNLLDGYEEWEKTGKVAKSNTTTAQPKQNTYNLLDGYEDWAKENVPKKKPPEPTFAEKAGQAINNAVDYAQKTALPAAQNALNNLGNNINNTVNNWGKDFDNTVNNFGNNLYNGISQIGNITYNPQQNLITGGGVSVTQPAPELKVNNNILNQVGGLLNKPQTQPQQKFSLPQTTPNIPQYQPKQTGVLNPAVNAVGDVISEIGDSTFRTGARLLDNIYENSKKTRINPLTGEKSTVNDINMWTIAKGIRDTLDPAKAAYSDQNPAYFENKYFGSKENRGMLKALERGEIKPYTDEDFNYLQTNAVKNIDLKKNELQKLLDSGQISAQKADELYKGYINEVREQTKAQRVGMLEHNFRLQNEAEANFARVEQNSELANKAFAAYILAQTAGTVAPLELGGQKIGQAVTQAATKAAKEKLYKKLFYEEGLKAGLDKAVIDNAYKQVGKDFFLKNYAEKGFEEFGLTGAKKTAAEMGQNLLKGTIAAGTDMGVIGAASNAAANNTALVDTGVNPVEAFIEGAKEGAPYGAMSLMPFLGQAFAKALQNIKIKGKMKPYQTGTAVDIYKENPYVRYGYENGNGFYTYEDRTNGRTNKNFTEEDIYKRGGKKWEQIPQDIENLAPKTAAKQAAKELEKVTESNLQAPEIAAQTSKAASNIVPEVKPVAQPEQKQETNIEELAPNISAKRKKASKDPEKEKLIKELRLDVIEKPKKPEYSKEMKDEALDIIAAATGKGKAYVQMIVRGGGKRGWKDAANTKNSHLEELLEGGSENLVDSGIGNGLKYYNKNGITYDTAEIEGGYETIRQAWDDLVNDNFYPNETIKLTQYDNALTDVENKKKEILKKIIDEPENIVENIGKYSDEFYDYVQKNAPQDAIDIINLDFYEGLEKVYNYVSKKAAETKEVNTNNKIAEIAPKTIEKQTTNGQKAKKEPEQDIKELHDKAKALGVKGNIKSMKPDTLRAKIKEAETKVDLDKDIWEGWRVGDFVEELEPQINQIYEGNSISKPFKNREELKKWCMDNQPYYKKYIPDVVNYFANKYNIPNTIEKAPVENKPEQSKIEKLAPNISKKQMIQEKVDKAAKTLSDNQFVPESQKQAMLANMKGEEKEHFADLVNELQERIDNAPALYQTDGVDREKIKPVLHYFGGNFDLYVTEIDKETGEMYGLGGFNGDYEFGYNSMENLKGLGDRLNVDLYPDKNLTVKDLLKEEVEKDENIGYNDSGEVELYPDNTSNKDVSEVKNGKTIHETGNIGTNKEISEELPAGLRGSTDRLDVGREDIGRNLSDNEEQPRVRSAASYLGADNRPLDEHKAIIEKSYKNQHELNQAIKEFINNKEYEKYKTLPDEIKDFLKKYTGSGGLEKQGAEGRGLLSEYYTPSNVVKKMWDLTAQYIDTDGAKVLEPSVGIGRFLEYAPENAKFDVVEMHPVSAKITELLYPNANVEVGEFQKRFIKNNNPVKKVTPEYDIVIGNPPYGDYSGTYKGMGEGAGIERLEDYFIKRGLDVLNGNGIMTFIIPSSFLNKKINKVKLEIATNAELLDAYRLPEKVFDTTTVGTDIIVLRKTSEPHDRQVFNSGIWFEKHPEKVLGEIVERPDRHTVGKMEKYVKGDKNAVDNIKTDKKDIRETVKSETPKTTTAANKPTQKRTQKPKTTEPVKQEKVDYEVYEPAHKVNEEDIPLYADTRVDGTLPKEKYKPGQKVNQYEGELYNDFNYLQGNLYEKLDALEKEDISPEQKEIQRKKIENVLPKPKKINEFELNPLSDFVTSMDIKVNNPYHREYSYYHRTNKKERELYQYDSEQISLNDAVIQYVSKSPEITKNELKGVTRDNVVRYLSGRPLNIDYGKLPPETYCNAAQKAERKEKAAQQKSDCREVALKLYNEYLRTHLDEAAKKQIEDLYNREYNSFYQPNYLDMPLLIQDVSANFKGNKLQLREAQIEGINFLNNQGVGLLGFDVGVGKTLTSIIATVQNMKMGRCKRPLIICPQATLRKNWLAEIQQLYPNLKVNVLGNLGRNYDNKFNGEIEEGTLTLCSYQALDNLWYKPETIKELLESLYGANEKTTQNKARLINDKKIKEDTARQKEKQKEDVEKLFGLAKKGNSEKYRLEDLGFDHITVDEAHNFKNLFNNAKAYNQKGMAYNVDGGNSSTRAVRLYMATQYILSKNNNRNVYLLSATPFTNKPLEVFNMLSYIAKDDLDKMNCNNVHQFIETFAEMRAVDEINYKNELVTKDVCVGFKNKDILYKLRDKYMMMRKGKESELKRPNKHTKKVVLSPTPKQEELLNLADDILSKASGKNGEILQGINLALEVTLSPDVATKNFEVSPDDFIKNSPKFEYIVNAIKLQHEHDKLARQIIYSPRGIEFFGKIKEYLVKHKIFKDDEVAIITGATSEDRIAEYIDSFNDRDGKLRLIIGSGTINEGVNLNTYSTTMYLPFIGWNPTEHQQAEGRIWRSGNKYKDCRFVVPLLKNSSDSFKFQKLATKITRINDMLFKGEDAPFIDPEELDAEAQKLALITNPVKKAKAFVHLEEKKLRAEMGMLEGRKDAIEKIEESLKSAKNNIEYYEKVVSDIQKEIKEMEDKFAVDENGKKIIPDNNYSYKNSLDRLKTNKKYLADAKAKEKRLIETIKVREYDLSGADTLENIDKKLQEYEEKIESLKELEESKIREYQEEYDKQNREAKTIQDQLNDFKSETENMYKKDEGESFKQIGKKSDNVSGSRVEEVNGLTDIVYDKLSKVLKISKPKLSKRLSAEIKVSDTDNIAKGEYSADKNVIEFFKGADASTSVHEVGHWLLNTWVKLAPESPEIARDLKSIRKHLGNNGGKFTTDEQEHFASSLEAYMRNGEAATPRLEKAFARFKRALKTIYKTLKEIIFKQKGEDTYFNRKDIKNINDVFNRIFTTEEERIRMPEEKAEKETSEHIRNWVGEIGKNRYDVNKTLNSLINITNQKAKSFKVGATGEQLRELMPFLRERTDFPDKLNRPDLQKIWNKLSDSQKAELRKLADDVSAKFERFYKEYQDLKGVLSDSEIKNHISHLWETKNKKQEGLLTNYFATNSRFAKERTIESLYKGIQGIETESGETLYYTPKTLDYAAILKTSSDSFIKAISDIKLAEAIKDLKVGGQKAVLPSSKAPSDWVEIDHPALNKAVYMGTSKNGATTLLKQSVKVHPAVAETLKTVFETPKDPNKFVEILRKYNISAKMAELGFSAFHTVALSEAAVGNLGIKETLKVLNPVRAYKEIKYNDYGIYKDEALAKRAINDGLQFGSTLDLDRKTIENLVDNLVDIVNKGSKKDISSLSKPIAETLKTGNKALKLNNKILWDYLHNNYKLIAYDLLTKRFGKKIQKKQDRELSKAERREVAQWVNDSYGGQIWEFLKLKPSERNLEQFLLLSADWLRSTTRQFMGMFSSKMTHNLVNSLPYNKYGKFAKTLSERWGVVSNTGDIEASALRGQLAREFWTRVAVISAIGYNTINAICREWDRKHHPELYPEKMTAKDYTMLGNSKGNKFNLFIGRNSDGTERYARVMKQFKEVPEMLLEPHKKLGGKLSPVIQLASQLFTGHTASGFKNKDFFEDKYPYTTMKTGTARLAASAKTIGKSFAPYSLNDVFNPDKDFTPVSFFLPVSKGTTKGKGKYEFAKNIYDKKNVKEVAESLKRNGYSEKDIKKTYKSARSEVRRQYRDEFVKAIESGDKKKVKEVAYRLRDKKGLSEAEITLIYKKAIKKVKEKE